MSRRIINDALCQGSQGPILLNTNNKHETIRLYFFLSEIIIIIPKNKSAINCYSLDESLVLYFIRECDQYLLIFG